LTFISGFFGVTLEGEYVKPYIGWLVMSDEKVEKPKQQF